MASNNEKGLLCVFALPRLASCLDACDNMELRHSNNERLAGSVEGVSGRLDCCHNVCMPMQGVEKGDKKIDVLILVPAFSRDTA